MNDLVIAGFEFTNYRSIGDTPVIIRPVKKVNILIGQNNTGKSNVTRAIQTALGAINQKGNLLQETDIHLRGNNPFGFKIYLNPPHIEENSLNEFFSNNEIWFDFVMPKGSSTASINHSSFENISDFNISNAILKKYFNSGWNRPVSKAEIAEFFQNRNDALLSRFYNSRLVEAFNIPEFRQIREGSSYTHDGQDLIRRLAEYKSPLIGNDANIKKFKNIEKFTCKLLHLPDVLIDVPSGKQMIILQNGDLRLPLKNFGTGVHELIILLTAVTEIENAICCIEEPEIHLHPRLQTEFVKYLLNETNNTYFLTTHSATLINMAQQEEGIQIFHLSQTDGETHCSPANSLVSQRNILDELGIKPSDLLQVNCIIWVEGASDRIYIKRWLELLAPEFVEDHHYKFLYYANIYSFADEAIETEFESLFIINKNIVFVQDSDKSSDSDKLSEKKARLAALCNQNGGIAWTTEGREIENYLTSSILRQAWKKRFEFGLYDEIEKKLPEELSKNGMRKIKIGKVDIAKRVVPFLGGKDIKGDLKNHLVEIIEKIRVWNT